MGKLVNNPVHAKLVTGLSANDATGDQTTDTTVIIAPVRPTPGASNRYVQLSSDPLDIFTDYYIENRYEQSQHVWMMGITTPDSFQGASAAFAQTASPTLLWIADWTACRFQSKPLIPAPLPSSMESNWVLLAQFVTPAMEIVGPDGTTPLWRISGTYVYGNKNPKTRVTELSIFPRPPWVKDEEDRNVPNDLLTPKLIDNGDL